MLNPRIVVCSAVLTLACAAQNAADPGVELPDASEEPTPDAVPPVTPPPRLDASTPPSSAPDAAPLPPPASPDAAATAPDSAPVPPEAVDNGSYTCTHLVGINATAEWYSKGFETMVDNAKWQLVRVHSGFVQIWADPSSNFWNTAPTSPCAQNSKSPDRVIFVALNFDYNTLEQWLPNLRAVAKNIKAKWPGVKRIELGSFVRAPGNKACPQRDAKRSVISAAQDQAELMVAAENPGLVFPMPDFEAKTCSEYSGNPPHPSATGGAAWAKMHAEHYGLGK